ncbi:uncharacterized protein LOC112189865 [Rosa chinensis]|uniref:uncharacterized protein LOC112189865 n=1 Tax=Rosa chinensis TaxID=74649 RepID=UPI000D0893BE|nr:uncharacterized protein LOC112189865 [Rosa chinensis]
MFSNLLVFMFPKQENCFVYVVSISATWPKKNDKEACYCNNKTVPSKSASQLPSQPALRATSNAAATITQLPFEEPQVNQHPITHNSEMKTVSKTMEIIRKQRIWRKTCDSKSHFQSFLV